MKHASHWAQGLAILTVFLRYSNWSEAFHSDSVLCNLKKKFIYRTEVNLDNHVRVPKLDPRMESPDKLVEDYASNLSTTTISKSMPLWDVHLLNVQTSEAQSTCIIRVHHSLGDGISLMSLLLSCTRKASDAEALPSIPTIKRSNPRNNSGGFWQFLLKLWCLALLYWNTIVDIVMSLGTIFFLEDTKTPLKATLPLGTPRKRFVHKTISLDDVKLVKNAMGTVSNKTLPTLATYHIHYLHIFVFIDN